MCACGVEMENRGPAPEHTQSCSASHVGKGNAVFRVCHFPFELLGAACSDCGLVRRTFFGGVDGMLLDWHGPFVYGTQVEFGSHSRWMVDELLSWMVGVLGGGSELLIFVGLIFFNEDRKSEDKQIRMENDSQRQIRLRMRIYRTK